MNKRLYIPHLGDELTMVQDWVFTLYKEYRNDRFACAMGITRMEHGTYQRHDGEKEEYDWETYDDKTVITLPKGTVLKVDRIYIRSGARDYDSVTFRVASSSEKRAVKKRFWVKLLDANCLVVDIPPQV